MALKTRTRQRKDLSVEYAVYVFHKPFHNDNFTNPINWEKRHTTWSMRVACRRAESLFKSNAYDRVIVKKKFFDPRTSQCADKTLKIYQQGARAPAAFLAHPLFVFLVACSLVGLLWIGMHAHS